MPSQITRYQNALKYARTKVDYVFGFGLYMAPSNMELRIGTIQGYNNKIILSTHDQKLWWNATVNLSADATSYSGNVSGTTTKKSTPEVPTVLSKPQKPDIPPAVQGKIEIGAWGMPITIPTQKQADEIYKKRIEQYHKIKDTYGPTITPDPHQMSLIPKTTSDPQLLTKSGTHKKIKHDPAIPAPKSANQPALETQSTTETHENNKTALILGSIIVGSVALIIYEIYYSILYSLAAAYNNPATSTTRAHKLLPNQFTTLPVADSSQDTMDPIAPGKAAAAFPARFASNRARL